MCLCDLNDTGLRHTVFSSGMISTDWNNFVHKYEVYGETDKFLTPNQHTRLAVSSRCSQTIPTCVWSIWNTQDYATLYLVLESLAPTEIILCINIKLMVKKNLVSNPQSTHQTCCCVVPLLWNHPNMCLCDLNDTGLRHTVFSSGIISTDWNNFVHKY